MSGFEHHPPEIPEMEQTPRIFLLPPKFFLETASFSLDLASFLLHPSSFQAACWTSRFFFFFWCPPHPALLPSQTPAPLSCLPVGAVRDSSSLKSGNETSKQWLAPETGQAALPLVPSPHSKHAPRFSKWHAGPIPGSASNDSPPV